MSTDTKVKQNRVLFIGEGKDVYLAEVRQQVDRYFKEKNIPASGSLAVHLKGLALVISCGLIYCTLLFGWLPAIPRLLLWALLGINEAFIAVNIGHDALHGSYTSSPSLNRILGFLAYDCIGLSSYVWKETHNRGHHIYTNIAGADPDIDKPGLLRLSPHDPCYAVHSFQHWYIWLLYSLVGLNWILFTDYVFAWKHRREMGVVEITLLLLFKAVNLVWLIALPLLFSSMPVWQLLVGYLLMQVAGGFSVALIFQLAHLVENVDFPLPNGEGIIGKPWSMHEMETTSNFGTDNKLLTHIVGGLNFQIEHHLLPKVSHAHYFDISKIVRQTAKKFGLPYHEMPTMTSAIASHARVLKALGNPMEHRTPRA